ncbi:UDP-N-acetylglucosamine 1-carboxyvinyltransferase [Anaerotaenia torta]|uniref:UDP-N-acetylglucosamine 1-carboxyvinyltransferase n=1 Tax=Anaerotaenia torta TaxID=433293 RepID=UPI003D200110
MSSIEVIGGKQLKGELNIQGSKNAALPVIAATILNKGTTVLKNCPKIRDVCHMVNILRELGCAAYWEGNTLYVDSRDSLVTSVPEEFVTKMRSSILFLGALLGRHHEVTIAYPGGCSIGKRPIDYHLKAIGKMNVTQKFTGENENMIHCTSPRILGNDIFLEFPSVGATQNVILTAVLSEGTTRIFNAAREPEVIEVCRYLNSAGAKIRGEGGAFIEIRGVEALHDVEFVLSSDRIVAGTYMAAIAGAGGEALLINAPAGHLESTIHTLREIGCAIDTTQDTIKVCMKKRAKALDMLKTQPYPGFPTDMQSQMMSVLCLADGESIIMEEIFESRFQTVEELQKMGALIRIEDENKKAVITGVKELKGATVEARDLRGGAALVIAGLCAQGTTIIRDATSIERGYENICRDLELLGAEIRYCSV